MKRNLSLFTVFTFSAFAATAQCDLNPVITPSQVILCPGATDTISVSGEYDSYQWFQNNKPIEGATNSYYVVEQYRDAATFFKVAVTKNGCADTSRRILVDGYVFALPYVITTGEIGTYNPLKDVTFQCPGDSVIMTMGDPYNVNIQWYNAGRPIPGATEKTFQVTQKGSYTVCGSPAVCPSYTDCQSIPMNFSFDKVQPVIIEKNDTLFASDAKTHRWYYQGRLIPGAQKNYIVPDRNGAYTVGIKTTHDCTGMSPVYNYKGADALITVSPNPVINSIHVRVKKAGVAWIAIADMYGNRYKLIPYRNDNEFINVSDLRMGTYSVQLLNNKQQVIGSTKIFKQ